MFSFSYYTSSTAGHKSLYLVTLGHIWQLLGTTGNTISALCWSLLATPGHKLQDMVAKCQKVTLLSKNGFWSLSATSGHINCQMVTSGNLWSHNWQHCSYTVLVSHTLQHEPTLGQLYRVFNSR